MKDFVASNGIPVALTNETPSGAMLTTSEKDGTYPYTNARGDDVQALREFFQAEADERLGRWRFPAAPNWVCYATGRPYEVVVFNEAEPTNGTFTLSRGEDTWPYARPAANAYFDAHPWHDAQPGEVWELTVDGEKNVPLWIAKDIGTVYFKRLEGAETEMTYMRRSAAITAGRRIWPEVSE